MHNRLMIIGAAGDLTSRYLLPALARLRNDGLLPKKLTIDAVSQDELSDDEYRKKVEGPLAEQAAGVKKSAQTSILKSITYHQADATDPEALRSIISSGEEPIVFYLALPPAVFYPAVEAIIEAGAGEESRIVVEKPHGEGLESTRKLNRLLHRCFSEESVFRIDHFLGHQTVQNLLGIRFGNRIFEPLWNSNHVERVEIRFDETLAIEGRAGYYDHTGALKDMLQNHLLQLLCFVAMEPPLGFNPRDLRDRKVDLLRAVRSPSNKEIKASSVRAHYTAGKVNGKKVPSYHDEQGVDPKRGTETFAQIVLPIDNWRWAGVPFTLRSGKALERNRQEILIRFRDVPYHVFGKQKPPGPNVLRLAFEPDRMALDLNLNGADNPFELEPATLELELAPQRLPAYARLLLDVLNGDPTLSIRADDAEESWRIVEPVVDAWSKGLVPLQSYSAGSSFEP